MATNYVQPGKILSLAAPYDRTSGQGALIGSFFGVALGTVLSGATGQFQADGVWTLPKLSAQAWTVGARIYWDNTNKWCTTVDTGNTLIGIATAVASNPSSTGVVRLNGAF
jgi:predicted RecA/RadA family phage recombinase